MKEEKRYSLSAVIEACEKRGERVLDKQRLSGYFRDSFFKDLNLEKEWESLKVNGRFAFSREEVSLLADIYVERNKKLKKDQQHHFINPDPDYMFRIMGKVMKLFDDSSNITAEDSCHIQLSIERYLTKFVAQEFSISRRVEKYLSDTVSKEIAANIDSSHYLNAYDKYVWQEELYSELCRRIDWWNSVFQRMERICHDSILDIVEKDYDENNHMINQRTSALIQEMQRDDESFRKLIEDYEEETNVEKKESLKQQIQEYIEKRSGELVMDIADSSPCRDRPSTPDLLDQAIEEQKDFERAFEKRAREAYEFGFSVEEVQKRALKIKMDLIKRKDKKG